MHKHRCPWSYGAPPGCVKIIYPEPYEPYETTRDSQCRENACFIGNPCTGWKNAPGTYSRQYVAPSDIGDATVQSEAWVAGHCQDRLMACLKSLDSVRHIRREVTKLLWYVPDKIDQSRVCRGRISHTICIYYSARSFSRHIYPGDIRRRHEYTEFRAMVRRHLYIHVNALSWNTWWGKRIWMQRTLDRWIIARKLRHLKLYVPCKIKRSRDLW